ncbi:MAG: IclR family transcriptional regulator [Acidobacteria bacterium]|nr:IclR family transcriptional regulator [Acidobacteriota bacterium]
MAAHNLINVADVPSDKPVYLVPAVDRAFRIIELLKANKLDMSLAEITRATGWHKSSIQKLLVTLSHHGILERNEDTKRYSLGIKLAEYGRIALNKLDIRVAAKSYLKELVEYSEETAVLAILNGTKMVMIDKKEPVLQIRASPFIGTRFPATATSNGKAFLAWLPDSRTEEILNSEGLSPFTGKSILDPAAYRANLEETRKRGYAIDRGEFQEGVSGVSAPVFSPSHQLIATISIVGPEFRMTEEKIRDCGEKCMEVAERLSARLAGSSDT